MKLKLDLEERTLQVEDPEINLGKLVNDLDKILPNGEWKEFKLILTTITNWTSPIIIERDRYYPNYPWIFPNIYPTIYCDCSISDNPNTTQTSYCIEMK